MSSNTPRLNPTTPILPKVAIPRLRRPKETPPESSDKHRVQRACTNCRKRKVKCSGDIPQCKHCKDNYLDCVYDRARRDRLKTATEQNEDMARLLRELSFHQSEDDRRRIDDLLSNFEEDVIESASSTHRPSLKRSRPSEPSDEQGERDIPGNTGSNESLDLLDENLTRDDQARATGFVGKNSEIQWLRHLKTNMDSSTKKVPGQRLSDVPPRSRHNVTSSTFYLDSADVDIEVDEDALPSVETAKRLINYYLKSVQDTFPIISRQTGMALFDEFYPARRPNGPHQRQQQAMLNLIFAIGEKFSYLVGDDTADEDERHHLIYQARARKLGIDDASVISHPDLQQIVVVSLLALYYFSVGQISRAWIVIGLAVRFACALGLHLRNEDVDTDLVTRERLVRLWWAIYSLERAISAVTGRPSVIVDIYCSVPLPLPLSEDQLSFENIEAYHAENPRPEERQQSQTLFPISPMATSSTPSSRGRSGAPPRGLTPANSGTYLGASVRISLLTQRVLDSLYAPSTASKSWSDTQHSMATLLIQLDYWVTTLPAAFDFTRPDILYQREHTLLELCYHSTRVLITRPCVCRLDRRIENQTRDSDTFNQEKAQEGVDAAKAIANMLSGHPAPDFMYWNGPWWSIVHNLMQALAVLMLELSMRSVHMTHNGNNILHDIKKIFQWLKAMKERDPVAEKAHKLALEIMLKLASHLNKDVSDLVEEDPTMMPEFESMPYGSTITPSQTMPLAPSGSQGYHSQQTEFDETVRIGSHTLPHQEPGVSLPGSFHPAEHYQTAGYWNPNFSPFQQAKMYNPFVTTYDQMNPFNVTSRQQSFAFPDVQMQDLFSQPHQQYQQHDEGEESPRHRRLS